MSITDTTQVDYPSFAAAAASSIESNLTPAKSTSTTMPVDAEALKRDLDVVTASGDKTRYASNGSIGGPIVGAAVDPAIGAASLRSSPAQHVLINEVVGVAGAGVKMNEGYQGVAVDLNSASGYGAGMFGPSASVPAFGPGLDHQQQQMYAHASPYFGSSNLPPPQAGAFGGASAVSTNGHPNGAQHFLGQPGQGVHGQPNHQNGGIGGQGPSSSPYAFGSPALGNGPSGGQGPANGQPNPSGFDGSAMNGYGSPSMMGMMSPMMGMASPQLGSPFPNQGAFGGMPSAGFGMMGGQGAGLGLAAHGSIATTPVGRTVYVGNLPSDASVDELLSQVRFGPIESLRILPEKSCAFISFLDQLTAAAFHSDAVLRKIRLHDQDLKIGWGKPSAVPPLVVQAVQQSGATRNVYLGNLDESTTEESLRDDLSRFGPIDQVKIVRDKNIAFVHFLSIATAIKVIQALITEPEYAGKRVSFGKDRTAYVPRSQQQQAQHNLAAAAMGSMAANYGMYGGFGSPAFSDGVGSPNLGADPNAMPGNRTIYLGNIHPETTTEEICNTIRGGILQQIRYIPEKHICFITFVEPHCALAFFQHASYQGLALHNRRLKVGWGKNSGPTLPGIAMVVQSGGSRNVYVGNIEDFETFSEERLRKDFGEYGDIELVNFLREKQCCFVNFTNIANAIKAIEGIKASPDYSGVKISFGKDRCGGPPRAYPRAFKGFDLSNHHHNNYRPQRQQHNADGGHGNDSSAQSPYQGGVGSPLAGSGLEGFDSTSALSIEYLTTSPAVKTDTLSLPHAGGLLLEDGGKPVA